MTVKHTCGLIYIYIYIYPCIYRHIYIIIYTYNAYVIYIIGFINVGCKYLDFISDGLLIKLKINVKLMLKFVLKK